MTDQYDPRNSDQQRRGDADATEVWRRQPEQPTEQYDTVSGSPEQPTEYFGAAQQHPGDPRYPGQDTELPGRQSNPTQALPAYDPQFDAQAPGATQAYPTYGNPQYGNPQYGNPQYGATQQYPVAPGGYPPAGGEVPPQPPFTPGDQPPGGKKRSVATWVAAGVVGILVAVIAIVAFSAFGSKDDGTRTAFVPPTTTAQAPSAPPKASTTAPAPTTDSPLGQLPGGLGEVIGDAGGAVGTVKSNDGGTLVIDSIGGSQLTILTTSATTLIALDRRSIADLVPGDNIVVQGSTVENGTMTAETILSTTLPSFGN